MAVGSFKRFTQAQCNNGKQADNESMLLSSLFQSISLNTHEPCKCVIFVREIIDLYLGGKVGIVNRITPRLTKLRSDANPLIWENIAYILICLSHALKDSMHTSQKRRNRLSEYARYITKVLLYDLYATPSYPSMVSSHACVYMQSDQSYSLGLQTFCNIDLLL